MVVAARASATRASARYSTSSAAGDDASPGRWDKRRSTVSTLMHRADRPPKVRTSKVGDTCPGAGRGGEEDGGVQLVRRRGGVGGWLGSGLVCDWGGEASVESVCDRVAAVMFFCNDAAPTEIYTE